MGDRAQVYVPSAGVYLYTHWEGYHLPEVVASALDRGRERWHDPEYLARIIFSEMIRDDLDGTAGFGIGNDRHGDVFRVIHLDTQEGRVTLESYDGSEEYSFETFTMLKPEWP